MNGTELKGRARLTRLQAAAAAAAIITLRGDQIQPATDRMSQSPCRGMFCCMFPQHHPWGVSLH